MNNSQISANYGCHWDWFTFVFTLPNKSLIYSADSNDDEIHQAIAIIKSKLKLDDANWYSGHAMPIYHYDSSEIISGEDTIIIGFNREYHKDGDIMVQMSGSGYDFWLRYLDAKGYDVLQVERELVADDKLKMRPSRVDIAMDLYNFDDHFSPLYVNKVTSMGNYIGRSRPTWVHSYGTHGTIKDDSKYSTEKEGTTLYFGKGSDKMMRIYNKLAERFSKKSKLFKIKSWYRWEYQLRGVNAVDFWNLYLELNQDIESAWRYWLSINYRWIEKIGSPQKKISRYPNADFYQTLIDGFEDVEPIKHQREPMTYERTQRFVQVSTTNSQLKLIAHDIYKYQQNGVSYEDAKDIAIKNVIRTLTEKLDDGEVNLDYVKNYFVNEHDDELVNEVDKLMQEQYEHRDGV